jgi:hypothetical protein
MTGAGYCRALSSYVVAGALLLFGLPTAHAVEFPAVVEEILASQTSGPISKMGPDQKSRMIACVIRSLDPLPAGKKRYVTEGATFDERQDRFGEVVKADHAKWQKAIAKACAKIAMNPGERDVDPVGEN